MTLVMSRPLPSRTALGLALGVVVFMGVYCLAYHATQGRAETVWNAFSWPVINVLPFFAAFEMGKRVTGPGGRVLIVLAAAALSIGLDWAASGTVEFAFEGVRRLPALLAVTIALMIGDRLAARVPRAAEASALPLLPQQIDWVASAGNYVVLHGSGRKVFHRATLTQLEASLARHDFVRVHRSRLVRRGAVARVRAVDVVLHDGTSIATGSRFRAALDQRTA
jgi:hypothetical protein